MLTKMKFDSLPNKNVKFLISAQAISNLGDYMLTISLSVLIFESTESAFSVAMIYLIKILPSLLSLSAGPLLERLPLKKIMVSTDIIQAILIGIIPFALHNLGLVYILLFFSSFFSVIFKSARMTILVEASSGYDLKRLNASDQSLQLIATFIGMALGGLLIGVNHYLVFWIDSSTFILSAVIVSLIGIGNHPLKKHDSQTKYWKEVVEGYKYIAKEPTLNYTVFGYFLLSIGGGAFNSMLVVYALSTLNTNNIGYTILEITQLLGLVIVGTIMTLISSKYQIGRLLAFSGTMFGIAIAGVVITDNIIIASIFCFLTGCFNLIVYTLSQTMVMERTSRDHRAKVMSIRVAISRLGYTFGALFSGVLVEWLQLSVSTVVSISGLIITLYGILAIFIPSVINYEVIKNQTNGLS
jgi:DHA3 family macrolide efflux protein-like MFS transporter